MIGCGSDMHDAIVPEKCFKFFTNKARSIISDNGFFENNFPPPSAAKRSSTLGIGYLSSLDTGFTVRRKSPQIQILDLSLFRTGTIGAAHSENFTGSRVSSLTRHSNSSSTLALKAYGMA